MTDIADKVAYVKTQGQTRDHHCHWPGCDEQVPPAKWGCSKHWFKLPKDLRDRIWRTFDPGQEVAGTPTVAYLAAARAVQDWIAANAEPNAQLHGAHLRPHPGAVDGVATLVDGRQVDSASEGWRHECEARYVAGLPNAEARRGYLSAVIKRRGEQAGTALEQLATHIYKAERQRSGP